MIPRFHPDTQRHELALLVLPSFAFFAISLNIADHSHLSVDDSATCTTRVVASVSVEFFGKLLSMRGVTLFFMSDSIEHGRNCNKPFCFFYWIKLIKVFFINFSPAPIIHARFPTFRMATGASNRGGQSALLPLSLSRSMRMAFDGGFALGFFRPLLCSCTAIHHHLHNHHRRQLSRAWSNSSGRLHHNQGAPRRP